MTMLFRNAYDCTPYSHSAATNSFNYTIMVSYQFYLHLELQLRLLSSCDLFI